MAGLSNLVSMLPWQMRLYPVSFLGLACCFWRWWGRGAANDDNDSEEGEDHDEYLSNIDKILATPSLERTGIAGLIVYREFCCDTDLKI